MYGIKTPDNEWFTGKLYQYNKNYDQTRREIKRLIADSEFTEDSDWDTEGYSTIPIKVRYKHYVDKKARGGYASGVNQRITEKQIEISDITIDFAKGDRFRTMEMTDEEVGYKIEEVDFNRNSYKAPATYLLPGLYKQYNSTVILTLK